MKLSHFRFDLPKECIATTPLFNRDECRLMVLHRKTQRIDMYATDAKGKPLKDKKRKPVFLRFTDILNYFDEGDAFIFNDTKLFPARLFGTKEKTDASIEVFLLRELNAEMRLWDVIVEPARKIRIGNKLFFDESGAMVAEVIDNTTSRGRTLRFLYDGPHDEFIHDLYALGQPPFPPYILDHLTALREAGQPEPELTLDDIQTIYAREEGAVTPATAGMHFTRQLLKRLEIKGVELAYITLHNTLGCFRNIEVEDLSKHKMESEQMFVGAEACRIANTAKENGHRVCLVGTSTAKAVETAVATDGKLKEFEGWTNKFLFPPRPYRFADALIANFYHPASTLLMSECSFGGYDLVMEAYKMAIENGYQFGCFGDAMLILDD